MERRRAEWIRVIALATAAVGTGLHLWWVFHSHLTSDQAISGLMGRQIRHGQMFTFYWGQAYGGAEPYLVAAVTALDPTSGTLLNLVPALLAALTSILVWRVGRRLAPPGLEALGVVAGAAMWLGPQALLTNSSEELGFRGVTLACGVGVILLALRAGDTARSGDLALLGLVGGVGWWSSPEIAYFALPVAGGLIAGGRRSLRPTLLLAPAGFVVGALPWIATNVGSGFASLQARSSPAYSSSDYAGRLSIFFHKTLPLMLGFRLPYSGHWVWGRAGQVLCVLAVAVLIVLAVAALVGAGGPQGRWARRGLGAGLLAFPLIYAAFPATSYWQQGQYGLYLVPLGILTVTATVAALSSSRKSRAWRGGGGRSLAGHMASGDDWTYRERPSSPLRGLLRRLLAGSGRRAGWSQEPAVTALAAFSLVAAVALTLSGFHDLRAERRMGGYLRGWGDQNRQLVAVVDQLRAAGVRSAYAEYWVAYDLDYLSGGRLVVTDPYADRWVAEYRRVRRAREPAWLFYHPASIGAAEATFASTPPGPYGYPESLFLARLQQLGVGYRIARAGVLDAVVPARPVAPTEVGIPPPVWR